MGLGVGGDEQAVHEGGVHKLGAFAVYAVASWACRGEDDVAGVAAGGERGRFGEAAAVLVSGNLGSLRIIREQLDRLDEAHPGRRTASTGTHRAEGRTVTPTAAGCHRRADRTGRKPYRVRFIDERGRWRSQVLRDRTGRARRVRRDLEAAATVGVHLTAGQTTYGEWAERWAALQPWRPGTRDAWASHYRRHVAPVLGHRPLADLRRTDLQAFVNGLASTLAPATVQVIAAQVAGSLKAAAADRLIVSTPWVRIDLPAVEARQVRPLTVAQVAQVADAMPPRWAAAVYLGAMAGLRSGEALGLTVDRVRFLERRIVVDRQLVTPSKGTPGFGPPKTVSSNRVVPAPAPLLEVLAGHVDRYGVDADGFLFTAAEGGPVRRSRFSEAVRQAVLAAAETDPTIDVAARFHALRHTFVSVLLDQGTPVNVVADLVGHESAVTTWRVYGHLVDGAEDRGRSAVEVSVGHRRPTRRHRGAVGP